MARGIYTQTIIAVVWDFDRTLIPGYSQAPLFDEYGVDPKLFWDETNKLAELYRDRGLTVGLDTAYLLHMLTYVAKGTFGGLTNSKLRELGARITMCPGMPEFLAEAKRLVADDERYKKHDIKLEHYVVSTGIKPLIEGSAVGPLVERIWANEFVDQLPGPGYLAAGHTFDAADGEIAQVGYMIDNTSKTRAIFEINKGPEVDVNARVPDDERRVPIQNMIYVADGPSDVPVFSVVGDRGGRCLGVYQTGQASNFAQVKQLQDEGRINGMAPADYQRGSQADLWLTVTIREIADGICDARERYFSGIKKPPGHVTS